MKSRIFFCLGLLFAMSANAAMTEAEAEKAAQALQWHIGPASEKIGQQATIKTDASLKFLDDRNTQKFLELTGNVPSANHYLLSSPAAGWWSVFNFDAIGYVKDDEKIDADALLKQMKEGDGPSNEERKRLGLKPLYTVGWHVAPHYDAETKRLEWGLKVQSEGAVSLNYTVRLLSRSGVMSATLVSSPETLDADVQSFKSALKGYEFNSGERYSEFKPGDHVAEFGLAALIAGGAAAVATKKGLWAVLGGFFAAFWKLLAGGAIALGAWFTSKFKKKS